jgi:hypothetical protein
MEPWNVAGQIPFCSSLCLKLATHSPLACFTCAL